MVSDQLLGNPLRRAMLDAERASARQVKYERSVIDRFCMYRRSTLTSTLNPHGSDRSGAEEWLVAQAPHKARKLARLDSRGIP